MTDKIDPARYEAAKALIGKTVSFDLQPYHTGRMVITEARPLTEDACTGKNAFGLKGKVLEGETCNRLFQHVSYSNMEPGSSLDIWRAYQRDIDAGHVTYVYPV